MNNERFENYDKNHCWQYDIRLNNYKNDIAELNTNNNIFNLKVTDFYFKCVEDKNERKYMIDFIKKHEWLGTISQFTTHWFAAYYNNKSENNMFEYPVLAGVILFNMPNAFSKMMGDNTNKIERLISRGACISWSPKNLASCFLMWCIDYMVKNTQYRLFTAYSDPQAKEIGTIYQACNFYYLGKNSGTTTRCINPYSGKVVSDRFFRVRSAYKQYAKELNIQWEKNWSNDQKMLWENVPNDIEKKLRDLSNKKYKESEKIEYPSKHKYAYVKGQNKKETKELKKIFESKNKIYEYPKIRGE